MFEIQLINNVRSWEKRLEIEDEKRNYNHQRFSNGSGTILKRTGRRIKSAYIELFHVDRRQSPVCCGETQKDRQKTM